MELHDRGRYNSLHATGFVDSVAGAAQVAKSVGKAAKGVKAAVKGKGGRRKGNAKLKAAWANYTSAQRAARIAAMRAGHARRKRVAKRA